MVHPLLQVFQHLAYVSLQYLSHLLQVGIVFIVTKPLAGSLGVAQAIFQTNLVFTSGNVGGSKVQITGAQLYLLHHFQQFFYLKHTRKGPYVFRSVPDKPTGKEHTGERFIADNHIRIGLVVLQCYVETWLKMFDQRVFQQEGIMFGLSYSKVKTVNKRNKPPCFCYCQVFY